MPIYRLLPSCIGQKSIYMNKKGANNAKKHRQPPIFAHFLHIYNDLRGSTFFFGSRNRFTQLNV